MATVQGEDNMTTIEVSQSNEAINIELEDSSDDESKGKGGSSKTATKYLDTHKKGLKFLERIRWKSLVPGGMFLSTAEDSIGISKAHAPFKGYKFIPALHVTDSYAPSCCCCCKGKWHLAGSWKYKEATGDIPVMRYGQKTALVNNTLFMFGGRVPGTEAFLNDLYALDLEAMIWTKLNAHGKQPSPRIRHTLTYVDGFLYLLGGNGENASVFIKDSFWRYDIRAGTWDPLTEPPLRDGFIAGHAAVALPQALLIFGGCSNIFGRDPNQFVFDTVGGKWNSFVQKYTESDVPEDHAVATFEKNGAAFVVFHGGISAEGATNHFSVLKIRDGEFEWFTPVFKDVDLYPPPVELSKHNMVFVKGRVSF